MSISDSLKLRQIGRGIVNVGYYGLAAPLIASLPSRSSSGVFEAVHQRFPEVEKLSGLEAAVRNNHGSVIFEDLLGLSFLLAPLIYPRIYGGDFPSEMMFYSLIAFNFFVWDGTGRMNKTGRGHPAGIIEGHVYNAQKIVGAGRDMVSRLMHHSGYNKP